MKCIKLITNGIVGFSNDETRLTSVYFMHIDDVRKIIESKTHKILNNDFNASELCEIYIKLQDTK